jgi:molybdenum cofactor cytidylyltransferase
MTSSIKRGMQAESESSNACILALVDQPRIDPNVINRIIDTFEDTFEKAQPLIVIPTYQGKNGHPILLDLALKKEVLNMDSSQGLRGVVHAHPGETARVEVSDKRVLEDCDSPEDYERILKR